MAPKLLTSKEDLFSDEYSKKILNAAKDFRSVAEISKACNIPLMSVYRRIRLLKDYKFLEIRGYIINGIRFAKYKRIMNRFHQNNPQVKKILNLVLEKPGISFTELKNGTEMQNGTLSHYLVKMLKDEKIIVRRTKRRTWFFPPSTQTKEMDIAINLRRETSKRILLFLLHKERAIFKEIVSEVKKSPSTVSLTLTQLIELGIIKRKLWSTITFELAEKKIVYDCIRKIEPNTVENLKDRFADTFSYF